LNRIFIVGFGKVGRDILPKVHRLWPKSQVWIIDRNPEALKRNRTIHGPAVLADGPQFLTRYQEWIRDEDWIIPALPIHLASQWLALNLKKSFKPRFISPDPRLGAGLPYCMVLGTGLLASYADFVCPDQCPAPLRYCFKTREKRTVPLWKFLKNHESFRGTLRVIESRQMAPGMGGYPFRELRSLLKLAYTVGPPFFVATACRCHGVIHGLTWQVF
jgi:hypothetical protein